MKILSIIITYNSEKWIRKNLHSVFAGASSCSLDVYVVDNGSADDTVQIIQKEFPQVILYQSKENLGFAKANNLAFHYALENQYDYVFLVNHDGWLLPQFWRYAGLILSDSQYAGYGLLSPVHYDETEKELDFGFKRYIGDQLEKVTSKDVIDVELMNGAFLFISKECLKAVKGFDPIFFFYGEDIDLCLRAKRKGYKIGVMKNAYVVHDRKERKMTKDRLQLHIFANAIVQIKASRDAFYVSFLKVIYANIYFAFRRNPIFGYVPDLYFKNIMKLTNQFSRIKYSFYNYK